jgi:hypothetical protein
VPECRCAGAWRGVPCGCAAGRWVDVGRAAGANGLLALPVVLRLRVVDGASAADADGLLTLPVVLWLRAADAALVLDVVRR